jgi:hypothetical protein
LALAFALAVVGTAASVTATHADFVLAHWQFYKAVTLPPAVVPGQLVELTLDREVYLESNPGETDLRLVAGRDREVPYQIVTLDKKERRESVAVEVRDLGYVEGKYSVFVADLGGSGSRHSEVVVDTDDDNFRRTVVVENSSDGETWAVVQDEGEIYDFTSSDREFQAHHTGVKYQQSTARYLRVKVLNSGEPPLKINGASVFMVEEIAAKETEYRPVSASVSRAESGTTYHQIDLGAGGIPVSRLGFQAETTNFHRRADIEGSEDGEDWRWLAGGQLYSFDTPKYKGSSLEMEFLESRHRYYRLSVADGDNVPLSLAEFTLHGADRLLRFQAEAGAEYALYYGNPVAGAPDYDLQQVVPYLETDDLPVAALGGQQPNEAFTRLDVPVTERLPWLMPAGVASVAVVLAALLYGVVRQAKKALPPPDGSESLP